MSMPGTDIAGTTPTRAAQTQIAYRKRLRQLVTAYARRTGRAIATVTGADLARDLDARADELAAATVRQYRAAIAYGVATGWLTGTSVRTRQAGKTGRRRGRMTSSLKLKKVTDADMRAIDAALRASTSGYAQELRAFLLANRLVGLRVCEWRSAVFLDCHPETGGPALRVQNAKTSNGRGLGPVRTLHLTGMPRDALVTIEVCARWLRRRADDGTFDAWQSGASRLLHRVCRRRWPRRKRHVTLYSTRHACAAQAKAVWCQAGVAALLGHRSGETASRHYARTARHGRRWAPTKLPKPDLALLDRVSVRAAGQRPRPARGP